MDGPKRSRLSRSGGGGGGGGGNMSPRDYDMPINTYGLSTSFLQRLGITGPLHTKIFVGNLDYKVEEKKLKQVFKIAGKIRSLELSTDKNGNSRGYAIIEYDHPVEAVQAISLFDSQILYDRRMTVRLDRLPDKSEGFKLPEGLSGIGIGLGSNGEPLRNVAQNLPNNNNNNNNNNLNNAPIPVSPPMNNNNMMNSNSAMSNLAALNTVVGALSNNPMAVANLNNLGLGMGGVSGGGVGSGVGGGVGNTDSLSGYNSGGVGGYSGSNYNSNSRNDFDIGTSNAIRNYSTQPDDLGGQQSFSPSGNGNRGGASDTIVIRNLPSTCTWQTLRDKFRDIGEVKFAEIRGNDCGVVRFAKERDAELAIKLMDGARFDGRTVDVMFF